MQRIISFIVTADPTYKVPTLKNPEVGTIRILGQYENKFFMSYDDEHTDVHENDEKFLQKIYDNNNADDIEILKSFFNATPHLKMELSEVELKHTNKWNLYRMLKGVIDNDQEIIDRINIIYEEQDKFLKSLGFPGISIL